MRASLTHLLPNPPSCQNGKRMVEEGGLSQSWQFQDFESSCSQCTCPGWSVFEGNCLKRTAFFGSSRSVSNLVTVSFDYFTRLHLLCCPSSRFGLRETAGTIWAHLSTHSAAYCPRFANPSLWTLNEGNVALPPSPQELVDPSCKADEERNLGWLVRSRIAWYKFLGPKTSNSVCSGKSPKLAAARQGSMPGTTYYASLLHWGRPPCKPKHKIAKWQIWQGMVLV